jgi:hypothetical protein
MAVKNARWIFPSDPTRVWWSRLENGMWYTIEPRPQIVQLEGRLDLRSMSRVQLGSTYLKLNEKLNGEWAKKMHATRPCMGGLAKSKSSPVVPSRSYPEWRSRCLEIGSSVEQEQEKRDHVTDSIRIATFDRPPRVGPKSPSL